VRCVDVSQPSLGGDAEHSGGGSGAADRLETPPLTPLYAVDGSSHVSMSAKGGKIQAAYHQKSSVGSGMEIHWEETAQPESKTKPRLDRKMPESRYASLLLTFLLLNSSGPYIFSLGFTYFFVS
jgi:hypothetical protein